ncbi:secretion protein HylD [Mesorhizobium soli]|uniref:Secretion protein HylD n=2 Tax=Pseudaminobacter soli (ex Li et al. 2025) TaxID=1295366 RepID=A0A2P7SKY7_9HYPH|nr:secretion protein HylD [Mesorhizobium soli]
MAEATTLERDATEIHSLEPVPPRGPMPQARTDEERRIVEWPPVDEDRPLEQGRVHPNKPPKGLMRRHPFTSTMALLSFIVAAAGGYLYWDYARHFETTDDAFIAARQFSVAPKVSGFITAVPVTDNQHVEAGDVIARIDARDYQAALEQTDAQVGVAQANIQKIDAQTTVQKAQVAANQDQVDQAQAALVFAQQQATRYQKLAQTGAGSVQNAQQYSSQLHQQQAALASAQANLTVAQRQLTSLSAQRKSAEASLAQAKAQRDQAQLNLSYTTVTAAQAGRVVNLGAAVGQYAQSGTGLAMFVPDKIWITANFKETQLDAMRPEQPVSLEIDAYPERTIHGHIASVQPGSGTAFSVLPAENATGNYVKIVQRVPVKLVMDNPPTDVALGPGMSVVPTVRVDPTPSLYERLRNWS